MKLHDFRALSFDCYGTLIDWESGLFQALQPLLAAAGGTRDRDTVLAEFAAHESAQQHSTPGMRYPRILAAVHRALAVDWGAAVPESAHVAFGASVPEWPAFADSAAALGYLKQHYKLIILSNVDRDSFAASNQRLGVRFDAVCTAQDVGAYKPDARNFRYLIAEAGRLGIAPEHILHTAQSLFHDHAPARAAGLASAWIDRRAGAPGWGATRPPQGAPAYDVRYLSLAHMVAAHQAELA